MIDKALRHCAGIGPARLAELKGLGIDSWQDVIDCQSRIPPRYRASIVAECERCLAALRESDIRYFCDNLASADKWRILHQFPQDVSYFDIETTGLEIDAGITVIVCWHQGQLLTFMEHENLDQFLDLLDEVKLLVSFNGGSFDVPRLLDFFHIPGLPCPHIDLRWSCYHHGHRGGLKQVTARLGLSRPADLHDADGLLAVRLWQQWQIYKDPGARQRLIRYCAADVILLALLAERLAQRQTNSPVEMWSQLPADQPLAHIESDATGSDSTGSDSTGSDSTGSDSSGSDSIGRVPLVAESPRAPLFGNGSPYILRGRRGRWADLHMEAAGREPSGEY